MTQHVDNSGPAFPTPHVYMPDGNIMFGAFGMSLRDYFASKAMHSAWATWHEGYFDLNKDSDTAIDDIARLSYQMADAMLKARSL